MVSIEHLPFNFSEKINFVNYFEKTLNLDECCIPKTTIAHTFFNLYRKKLIKYFKNYEGRVFICFYIWSDY